MARNTVICLLRNDLRVHDNEVSSLMQQTFPPSRMNILLMKWAEKIISHSFKFCLAYEDSCNQDLFYYLYEGAQLGL